MNKKNYLFLSSLIPDVQFQEVQALAKKNMQDAANELQWKIYKGLCENLKEQIKIINKLPIGSFPQYYKKLFVKEKIFNTHNCSGNVSISFCNLKFFRNFFIRKKIYKKIKNWCEQRQGEKIIFIYTLSYGFVWAIEKIKHEKKDVKLCCIIADLPNMISLSSQKSLVKRLFIKNNSNKILNKIWCVDYFVFLSKHMVEYLQINKPYCVMEGISSENNYTVEYNPQRKVILYTGTLHKKFGVINLLDAFSLIRGEDFELIICGIGDSENEILRAAEKDNRIKFKGQLIHDEVLQLQKKATVLINPRQNNEEFTKYSFPSKNLEYLSSGVPLIAYKLDGIPDEYDDYIIYPDSNSIEDLAKCIENICNLNEEERRQIGTKAKKFVSENKNYIVQTKKIIDLINSEN